MEFNCDQKELQNSVSLVEKIVATRSTLPIIGNILFQADKGGLSISANNLEIGIKLELKAKIEKEGAVLIPAKTLSGLASKLPNTTISFKLNEKGMIKISYNQSYFNIHILPPDEFPVLPEVKNGKSFKVATPIFTAMIKQTIFATATGEDKHVLTGVLLETGPGQLTGDHSTLRLVATDGYRLAKRGEKTNGHNEAKLSAIIPARALQELVRILDQNKETGEININISTDQISFQLDRVYLVSRVIQGQFPDYRQVLPKKSATKIILNTKTLLAAAERVAVIAAGAANIVKFELKNKKLHLAASAPDVGTIDEVLEAEITGEEKAQVAFNIRLIIDMLRVVETERVALELTAALGPGVIKEDGPNDYLYMVMPIRTQEAA